MEVRILRHEGSQIRAGHSAAHDLLCTSEGLRTGIAHAAQPWHGAELQTGSRSTSRSRSPRYQRSPFKSGACADCSGNPPAICINDMTNMPAHAPPIKLAKTHQNEIMGSPPFLPSVARKIAPRLRCPIHHPQETDPRSRCWSSAASSLPCRAAAASIFPGWRRASPSPC